MTIRILFIRFCYSQHASSTIDERDEARRQGIGPERNITHRTHNAIKRPVEQRHSKAARAHDSNEEQWWKWPLSRETRIENNCCLLLFQFLLDTHICVGHSFYLECLVIALVYKHTSYIRKWISSPFDGISANNPNSHGINCVRAVLPMPMCHIMDGPIQATQPYSGISGLSVCLRCNKNGVVVSGDEVKNNKPTDFYLDTLIFLVCAKIKSSSEKRQAHITSDRMSHGK